MYSTLQGNNLEATVVAINKIHKGQSRGMRFVSVSFTFAQSSPTPSPCPTFLQLTN